MSFCPSLVVPVYNHGATVGAVVSALAVHQLPIYLVDDGSDSQTAIELDRIAAAQPLVHLIRRPVNGGKGAAVMSGFRAAASDGCTHALQVDADGQHALTDVSRFLAAALEQQQRIICGVPQYDETVPRGRLYGRYATHVWVWIETLSLDIKDSMCGFRVYPLEPVMDLIDGVALGKRMDFDIEILVRLHWRGIRPVSLATRVTYPADGISHFRAWRDNLAISWLHTRLAVGMLLRLPTLVWRKLAGTP